MIYHDLRLGNSSICRDSIVNQSLVAAGFQYRFAFISESPTGCAALFSFNNLCCGTKSFINANSNRKNM